GHADPTNTEIEREQRFRHSGVPGRRGQERRIDAEEPERRLEALVDRRLEDDVGTGRHGEPRVARDLFLELARPPAGVAERHQHPLRPAAAGDGLEHVLRRREAELAADRDGRVPFADRLVQHEATVHLDRTAVEHRRTGERRDLELQVDALEQRRQIDLHRPVDDEAQRALRTVLGDEHDRAPEVRVGHVGHGDQELVGQVGRQLFAHASIVKGRTGRHNPRSPRCSSQAMVREAEFDSVLVWFRRDLRVDDHAALRQAVRRARRGAGGALRVRHANARDAIPALAAETGAQAVLANHDYEPAARDRDAAVRLALERDGRRLLTFKDQAIFERDELLTGQGRPFSVYTPYRNAWLERVAPADLAPHEVRLDGSLADGRGVPAVPALAALGFEPTGLRELGVVAGSS